jgi:tRNA-2-methylthio-N6-dimethylallyladenosine synthase
VFKAVALGMAFIAQFSPRPGTAAAKLPDNVTLAEKKRRWQDLTNLLTKMWLQQNKALLGKRNHRLVSKRKKPRALSLVCQDRDYKHILLLQLKI